ncbi:MAG: hypothetical protein LUF89_10930 [Ruminococcus sp.]|nr:hypothetical protein [Ruminococcus sp.]
MRRYQQLFYRWKGRILHSGIRIFSHLRLLTRWIVSSIFMGGIVGIIGVGFVYAISYVTNL